MSYLMISNVQMPQPSHLVVIISDLEICLALMITKGDITLKDATIAKYNLDCVGCLFLLIWWRLSLRRASFLSIFEGVDCSGTTDVGQLEKRDSNSFDVVRSDRGGRMYASDWALDSWGHWLFCFPHFLDWGSIVIHSTIYFATQA